MNFTFTWKKTIVLLVGLTVASSIGVHFGEWAHGVAIVIFAPFGLYLVKDDPEFNGIKPEKSE